MNMLKKTALAVSILLISLTAAAETFVEFVVVDKVWPDHKWGHVSLRVKDDAQDMIFDFGRYGKMWGFFDTEGEPVLRVWKNANEQHLKYQKAGNPQVHVVRFQATSAEAQAVLAHYEKITQGVKPYQTSKTLDYYNLVNPTFHAVANNCTTMSIASFMSGLPQYNVNNSKYAVGEDLYWWARTQAVRMDYDSSSKTWTHIWWPADLLNSLRKDFVSKGLATETIR